MHQTRQGPLFALVALATIAPAGVFAQQPGASGLLEEVVVTARRREESLQETPIAISVLSGDDMESMGVVDSRDMARFVPNLSTVGLGLGGALGDNITLRGIGNDRPFPDLEQGVGIYVDDVYFPRGHSNVVEMVELERVEVLRGPQGTLFGRNSMAGTIRYVTKKPSGELGGNVQVTTGELDRLDVQGTIDFPISDNWAGMFSFGQDTRDGYITHENDPGTNGSKDARTMRGTLRFLSDDERLTLDLGYTNISTRSDGTPWVIQQTCPSTPGRGQNPSCFPFAFLPPPPGMAHPPELGGPYDDTYASSGPYSVYGDFNEPDFANLDMETVEMTITYDISDTLTFKSVTADTTLDYLYSQDMDQSPIDTILIRFGEVNDFFQQEFQLLGDPSDRLHWQAGVFLYNEQPDYFQYTTAFVQEQSSPRVREQFYETDAWAVYAQGSYAINDRWTVTAGVRYTDEEKELTSVFTTIANPLIEGRIASNTASWDATTPMLSFAYQHADNLMFYGSLAEGFRSGGINFNLDPQPVPAAPNLGILPFDPEEATSIELGVKWNSSDGRFLVNTAIFDTDLDGQQLGGTIDFPGGFIGIQVNAGKSSLSGLETDFRANVSDRLQLRGTLAFFDGSFDEVGAAGVRGLIGPDSFIPNAPETSYSFGGTYTQPLANGGNVGFNFDYSWRDEMQSARNTQNNLTLDDLGLLNLRLYYIVPGDQLTLALAATNATDEYYFTAFRRVGIGAPFGQTTGLVGRPREWSVSANYRF